MWGNRRGKSTVYNVRAHAWERGWYEPGMSTDQIDDALAACEDFLGEPSLLEDLFRKHGHILTMSPKGHPELAGVGVEYCWGKAKMHFRRHKKERIGANIKIVHTILVYTTY